MHKPTVFTYCLLSVAVVPLSLGYLFFIHTTLKFREWNIRFCLLQKCRMLIANNDKHDREEKIEYLHSRNALTVAWQIMTG